MSDYGRYVGVNWVWATQIDIIHALFSIAKPILLLELALPESRGRGLLGRREVPLVFAIWAGDIALLNVLVWRWSGFWAGAPLIAGSFLVIAALVAAARLVPPDLLVPWSIRPRSRPLVFAATGFLFYFGLVFSADVSKAWSLPPFVAVAGCIAVGVVTLLWVLRNVGTKQSERRIVALVFGLFVFILFEGVVSQITLPLVLGADAAFVLFLRWLWTEYPEGRPDALVSTSLPDETDSHIPRQRQDRIS